MDSSPARSRWLLAGLAGCLLWAAARQRPGARHALIALDASQAGALCLSANYPAADFWERAQAIGVGAALFREDTLGGLMTRGEVLSFSREELEKWKAFGLVASAATLKANTVWVKDSRVLARLLSAGERTGASLSTSSAGGYHVIEFAEAVDPAFPAGYDLAGLSLAQSRGLAQVLGGTGAEDPGEIGLRRQPDGQLEAYPVQDGKPYDSVLAGRTLGVRARLPAALRAVYSHPSRLVLLRLDPALGVEGNLSALRGLLKPLKAQGVLLEAPPAQAQARSSAVPWRAWLAWLLAAVGPLLAARAGLDGFKRSRTVVLQRWPVASPVLEVAAGLLCAAGAAGLAGLAVSLVLGGAGASGLPESLAMSALAAPLVIGALALYSMDWKSWKRRWRQPLTLQRAVGLLLVVLMLLLLLKPRLVLSAVGLWGWAERAGETSSLLWWWRWRWREIVIGFPALLHAFFLLERRLGCPDCPGSKTEEPFSDPRGWLLAGLLGPSGVIAALGHPGAPLGMMLGQTAVVVLLGLLLGALLIGLRGPVLAWVQGPSVSRTIDPGNLI